MIGALISKQELLEFHNDQLRFDIENILAGLGMKLIDADDYLLDLINSLHTKAQKLVKPIASFSVLNNPIFDIENKTLQIGDFEFRTGRTITQLLKKSTQLVFFIASIGDQIEHFSKAQMNEGNTLEGFILDLIGSELAESATNYLHNKLEKMFAECGVGISNRYSPGYCNWPVSDQKKLFVIMGEYNCGVSLTESSLMMPIKSVSGVIGVGENLRRVDYKCRICDDEKCILRKQF